MNQESDQETTFSYKHSVLHEGFPETEYEHLTKRIQGTKFGQRKLFFALLQFLIFYCRPKNIPEKHRRKKVRYQIVYAGAAHGNNIAFASKLRPDVEFHLYDPGFFMISETERIQIHSPKHRANHRKGSPGFFSDTEAEYWREIQKKEGNVFFLSDIRRIASQTDDTTQEYQIQKDMDLQADWVRKIQPVYSQLKFRLPFKYLNDTQLSYQYRKYLPGTVYFGFWTGQSTETRLVVSAEESKREVAWDVWKYERNLAYFNQTYRTSAWNLRLPGSRRVLSEISPPELIHDYDSIAEGFLWSEYLVSVSGEKKATQENIARLSSRLTSNLGTRKISNLRQITRKEFAPF